MTEKLREVLARHDEIARLLSEPDVFSDPARYKNLMREQKGLVEIADAARRLAALESELRELAEIAADPGADPELRRLAEEERAHLLPNLESLKGQLQILLLPKDVHDDRNVIMEIRAGAGGEEAALFAGVLYRMYAMYAESKGWKSEVLSASETELGGFKEICFGISGEGAYARLKFESGVHRVQRVPETEASGRIHTSTVTVAVLPEAEEVDFVLNPADLQIDTFRAGGAGGQHVNKTESAVRIIHLPTGTVAECQDERSQHKNREKALKILRSRIYEKMRREQNEKIASERRSQVGTGDRSERIRTYNFPRGRVTDHRIGLTLYRLNAVLDGDLDEIADALIAADRAEKLKAQGE